MSKQLLLLLFFFQHRSIVFLFSLIIFGYAVHILGGVRKKIIINLVMYIPVTTMSTRLPGTILNFHTVNNNNNIIKIIT